MLGLGVWRVAQRDVIGATAAAIDGFRDNDTCQDPLLDTFGGHFAREY